MNFAYGANPTREQWKLPPVKPPEESERAFKYLEDLVIYMKSFPRVEFVTASQLPELFPDKARQHVFATQEIGEIARQVDHPVSFQVRAGYALSASEIFVILNKFVSGIIRRKGSEPVLLGDTPYGPALEAASQSTASAVGSPRAAAEPLEISWDQFSRTVLDVSDFLAKNPMIPSTVWFGSTGVSPESYLVALAQVAQTLITKAEPPSSVSVAPATLEAARYVAEDSPQLWDWLIFPQGFHSSHLMDLARLQAWTLKPALLQGH